MNSSDSDNQNDSKSDTVDAPSIFPPDRAPDRKPVFTDQFLESKLPDTIGKYSIIEKLGSGGMGVVFKAVNHETNQHVALKLIKRGSIASPQAQKRFAKESLMQSKIDNPYVVKFIDSGCENETHFIATEFVQGKNLQVYSRHLHKKHTDVSFSISRDILRGLSAIHSEGLIHRDVKPGNVIIVLNAEQEGKTFSLSDYAHCKLTDFGLARQIDQTRSLELTHSHATLGTPLYMAPEQQNQSDQATPAADVYSVGATLYLLLTGKPPFYAENAFELAEMHRFEQPQRPSVFNNRINATMDHVILKALEKNPNRRYPSAHEMLLDVEEVLAGRQVSHSIFPALPKTGSKTENYRFVRIMNATPEQLWPFVAETDRFNRAMGLPAPDFSTERDPDGGRKIFAQTKFGGQQVRWLENPFQWIENRRLSVLREFESGPFCWVASTVMLEPLINGQTRLVHEIDAEPRGFLGKLASKIQLGFVTQRTLRKVYSLIERLATNTEDPIACDAALANRNPINARGQLNLEQIILKTEASVENQNLLQLLKRYLATASDSCVSRIRPLELATKLKCQPQDLIDVCFAGAESGLLVLNWDVICPVCKIATTSLESLEQLEEHYHCQFCDLEIQADISNAIEISFRVHPQIRKVDLRTYCIGGPFHSPHVLFQTIVGNAQPERFGLNVMEGKYKLRSPGSAESNGLDVNWDHSTHDIHLHLPLIDAETLQSSPGSVSFNLTNKLTDNLLVRLEKKVDEENTLSVAEANENPIFRKLNADRVSQLDDISVLVSGFLIGVRIRNYEWLVQQIGENKASLICRNMLKSIRAADAAAIKIDRGFDVLTVGYESPDSTSAVITAIQKSLPENTAISVVINSGDFQAAGGKETKRYFGKLIRETNECLERAQENDVLIRNTILEAQETAQWLDSKLYKRLDDENPSNEFSTFEFK